MSPTTRRMLFFGLPVLLGMGLLAYLRPIDETTARDRSPLPPSPEPPRGARPVLRSVVTLPGDYGGAKPTVAADRDRRVVVVAMDGSAGGWRLVRWRSADGGRNWRGPDAVARWPDGCDVIFDPWLQTDHRGRFHLTNAATNLRNRASWPVVFSRSLDGGSTWRPSAEVAQPGDRPMLAVSPDGTRLVIAYATTDTKTRTAPQGTATPPAARHMAGVIRSGDRGRTWEAVAGPAGMRHAVATGVACDDAGRIACCWLDSDGRGESTRSVVCATADRGRTWQSTELAGRLQPDLDHPFSGGRFPVLARDGGGVLHAAFVAASGAGLWVRSSRDWRTWGEPTRLSSDGADAVRLPGIAAGGRVVHVSWMERRAGRYRVWYRGSKDQGAGWSDPLLLSRPDPASAPLKDDGFEVVADDDQTSLADDGAGVAHAVWAVRGSRRGGGEVWHAAVTWQAPE